MFLLGDKKFIVVPQELFDYLKCVAVEINEECLEFDDIMSLLYEIYESGKQDAVIEIIKVLEEALCIGVE